MKNKIYAILAVVLMISGTAKAQYSETNNLFYHSFRTPQSNLLNPALYPNKNSFYLMLPGVDMRIHTPVSASQFVYYDPAQDITVVSLDSLFNGLNSDNGFRITPSIQILGMGFKVNNSFINFNVNMVNDIGLGLPISAINALRNGNLQEDGTPITKLSILDGDIFNMQSYLEAGLGVGHKFESINLTVGARAKLLYGIINMQTNNTNIVLNTDEDLNSISADIYYQLQASTVVPIDTNFKLGPINVAELMQISNANKGFSFDIGARYDFGPFTFSASIIDISTGIHWGQTPYSYNIVPTGGNVHVAFEGANMNSFISDEETGDSVSLSTFFSDITGNMKPKFSTTDTLDYWYTIPTKVNLGASFSFLNMFRAGILFHGQFDRGLISHENANSIALSSVMNTAEDVYNNAREADFRFNTTVTLGANLFNWVEVMVGSSVVSDGNKTTWFNPGFGVVITPLTVLQIYAMADYMSNFYLVDCKDLNMKFGINLLLGKGGKSKSEDF